MSQSESQASEPKSSDYAKLKTVAILGCGPAGLLAAHAVGLSGHPLSIHSLPQKSVQSGAQFLHRAIPGVTAMTPEFTINYQCRGNAANYREKVYGVKEEEQPEFVSYENVYDGMTQMAWSLRTAYEELWNGFGEAINEARVGPLWLEEHEHDFKLIISSIPAPLLCVNKDSHFFLSRKIKVRTMDELEAVTIGDNTIIYEGTDNFAWYRASNICGEGGFEYGEFAPKPPGYEVAEVIKPIRTNCDCFPNIVRVGRYGQWKKGVLTHDAFFETLEVAGALR